MRVSPLLVPLALAACAMPPRLVTTATDAVTTIPEAGAALADADVVVLGEMHETPDVHRMHLALVRELHARRPELAIAMEMFERDAQTALLNYLAGVSEEATFLAAAKPWRNYQRDYRPMVEFAKENGLVVIAANAPRDLASRVAKDGIASIKGERLAPRETTAPEDEYWDAFQEAMKDGAHDAHGAKPESPEAKTARLHRYYEAQCLRDDTMAESVVDHVREARGKGGRPLVVLVCGKQHSDHGRGTVARIRSRMPELDVRIVSTESVADTTAGTYRTPKQLADLVILVAEGAEQPIRTAEPVPPVATKSAPPPPETTPAAPQPAQNDPNQRPALGLMPDYQNNEGKGVLVGQVRENGPAYKAGIEPGDYIVDVNGIAVTDVQSYTEALDQQIIGKTITIRIRRDDAEVALQILVGARSR